MGGVLLAILLAPGAIVVLLGLELLERRLFGSGPAATGEAPTRSVEGAGASSLSGDAGSTSRGQAALSPVNVWDGRLSAHIEVQEARQMAPARYEVRVKGALSERARGAFSALDVRSVPPQTIVFGELAEQSDLRDLLSLCGTMGLEVVSLRRLTADSPAAAREDERRPAATSRTPRPMRHPDPPG